MQQQVAAYINHPAGTSSRAVAKALKKHFGWTEAARKQASFPEIPGTIVKEISRLRGKIDIRPYNGNCLSTSNLALPENKEARVIAAQVQAQLDQPGTNCFSYTPVFFTIPLVGRSAIVIHEMLHSWAGMGVDIYESEKNYPPSLGNAIENPASYAALIRDLRPR